MTVFHILQFIISVLAIIETYKFSTTKNATHGIWVIILLLVLFN